MQMIAVTPENHANRSWRAAHTYTFAAGWATQPVVQMEAGKVASEFPLAFRKHGEIWELLALLGVQPGHNLAVSHEGKWLGRYVPALIRAWPFAVATPAGSAEPILCVDESTGLVGAAGEGEAFFDAGAQPSKALSAVVNFLRQLAVNRARTRLACKALADAGVLKPLKLGLRLPDGTPASAATIEDLHIIDAAKLAALAPEAFLALREHDALPLAYTQLTSLNQMATLDQLARKRNAALSAPAVAGVPGVTGQDSVLKFT